MASLQTPLLRPLHLPSDDLPLLNTPKTNFFPPKFESQLAPTAIYHNSKRKLKIPHKELHIIPSLETSKQLIRHQEDDSFTSSNNEVDVYVSGVKFMPNRSYSFDYKQVHGQLVKSGAIESNYLIGNKLALLYIKNGNFLDEARHLFDEMPERTFSLYAALIRSYTRAGRWTEVFYVLGLMILEEILPDMHLIPTILKACGAVQFLRYGQMIHGFVLKNCNADLFVGNGLIDFYAKCGELDFTRTVFDMMQEKDVVSWTALISAYMDNRLPSEAYDVFQLMRLNGVIPDLISWNTVVSGFARNGDIHMAFCLVEEMQEFGPNPTITTWNGLISGCVRSEHHNESLISFRKMLLSQNPNAKTLVSVLQACAKLKALEIAKAIHGYAIKTDLCGNIFIQGSLIDTYSKCGRIESMESVFKHVKSKNTTLWNPMIAAYVSKGKFEHALALLKSMRQERLRPDEITYNTLLSGYARNGNKNGAYMVLSEMVSVGLKPNIVSFNVLISGFQQSGFSREALKAFQNVLSTSNDCSVKPNSVTVTGALAACADLSISGHGKGIHGYTVKTGLESNVFVSGALVDMYGKCRDMNSATKVFERMKDRNTVVWNSLISGYIHNFEPENALKLLPEMLDEGIDPNSITFLTVLPGCGDLEDLKLGRSLHGLMVKTRFLDLDSSLVIALNDMYARCKLQDYATNFSISS